MDALGGVTVKASKLGALTVRVAEPVIVPDTALIMVAPWEKLVAEPPTPALATAGTEELQVAEAVRSCALPSV